MSNSSSASLEHYRHTLAHLLAAAVLEFYPDAKPTIGPAIDNGFYYDFEFSKPIIEADLKDIEKRMRKLLLAWKEMTGKEVPEKEARAFFKDNPYKLELIDEIVGKKEKITLYSAGSFTDLCRGGHMENPAKEIAPDSFKLDRIAGAYWRGSEKNKMLTRIYGLAFASKKELEAYETMMKEAEKRDHRRIAREQDLLVFSDLVGPGMPMFTPRGNVIRNEIIKFCQELNAELGYDEVHTPNINRAELFKVSGHYDKYKDDLLTVHSHYSKDDFFLKPMNCPQHTQIFASQMRSYRDLPIRYADFAVLYRDERPGELSGLTRLRSFSQDDGHAFCTESQIEKEISNTLETIKKALATYKIDYWMRLSLRDEANKGKYLGADDVWEKSQAIMRKLLKDKAIKHKEAEGEAAFYGPKIDIMAVDAIGREWQISTIQLDFNMPARFKLEYTDSDGKLKTPVMIHRALIGSPDRFMGILIEHYGGNFPLWLAPVQVKVIPVAEAFATAATKIHEALRDNMIRSEIDLSNDSFGKKVRNAKTARIPYFIILGEKDIQAGKVTLESRDKGQIGQLPIDEVLKKFGEDIRNRS